MNINPYNLPICVDLDGTLVMGDCLWDSMIIFIRRYPQKILHVFYWWFLGRQILKNNLAELINLSVENLPYNQSLINILKSQHEKGDKIYLVTGSAQKYAALIADFCGFFTSAWGSDLKTNLVGKAKAKFLVENFGSDNFIYIGNSNDDIEVWQKSKIIIAVNTSTKVKQWIINSGKEFLFL